MYLFATQCVRCVYLCTAVIQVAQPAADELLNTLEHRTRKTVGRFTSKIRDRTVQHKELDALLDKEVDAGQAAVGKKIVSHMLQVTSSASLSLSLSLSHTHTHTLYPLTYTYTRTQLAQHLQADEESSDEEPAGFGAKVSSK